MESPLRKRQILVEVDDDEYWWYTSEANAVKWSIVAAIFLIAFVWFIGGYYHAQSRMRNGMPPLAYHKWLVRRSQRERFQSQNNIFLHEQPQGYNASYPTYALPPPVYNPTYVPPPPYQPPQGASKASPSQQWPMPTPGQPQAGESSGGYYPYNTSPLGGASNAVPQAGTDGYSVLPPRPAKPGLFSRLKFLK